jgi:hypothetical protein
MDPWIAGMKIRFFHLGDHCCPMGESLKPIANLQRAVEAVEFYRKTLEKIGTPEAYAALDRRF